ncbi:MAG: HIT family protein [Proteobacteria bacterium]|nr:MAG: HIT family protein [Pseudomonadota bacterium]
MAGAARDCIFCAAEGRIWLANELAFATRDARPVSRGHTLVVPRRHCEDFFALRADEVAACWELIVRVRAQLAAEPAPPDGFNVGVNAGEAAGQSVPHVHVHVIPRYRGDVASPRGGVRNVVPHAHTERAAPDG